MNLIESIDALVAEQEILNEGLEVDNATDALNNLSLVLGHAASVLKNIANKDGVGSASSTTASLRQIDLAVDKARKALKVFFKSEITIGSNTKKALVDISDTVERQSGKIITKKGDKKGEKSLSVIAMLQADNQDEPSSEEAPSETDGTASTPVSSDPEFGDFEEDQN